MAMRRYLILILLILVSLTCAVYEGYADKKARSPMDMVIVLENSSIMKTNDPEFLIREEVSKFTDALPKDSCIGFILFSEALDPAMHLTSIAEEGADGKVAEALSKLNYMEEHANIPAAIESAIFQLEQDGRANTEKFIVLITDGTMDTGKNVKVIGRAALLKIYASRSQNAGIRIFGIAFTDQEYFEPIRILCRKTYGEHYRVSKAEDIRFALNSISENILGRRLVSEPEPLSELGTPTEERKAIPVKPLLLALLVPVAGILVFVCVRKGRKGKPDRNKVIQAFLVDIKDATDKKTYKINKRVTVIGRMPGNGVDIRIPKNTVSATHAQIECKNDNFYLIDLRSRNGTYLNGAGRKVTSEVCLKDGDVIAFDQYTFRFVMPHHGKLNNQTVVRLP
jgi:hypothetical protein